MARAQTAGLEKAVFTDARPASHRAQWVFFLSVIALLGVVYFIARDLLYTRLLYSLAQMHFERLASASVERIGHLTIDPQGDIILHNALATTTHRGEHREFFQADEVRLTFDGTPLREKGLRVMRVDLVRPVVQVRRETDGEWNLEWALIPGTRAPAAELPTGPDLWKDYRKTDDAFPPNGVHIYDGTIVVTFVSKKGRDAVWRMSGVRAQLARVDGLLRLRNLEGDFYGGRVKADAEIPRAMPLHIQQLKIDVRDADVSRMSEGTTWIPHPLKGTLNGVFSLTWDVERTGPR
ncbi:MAG TPA: hypothetical protein VEJ18_18835, partial [Planctomycetota bacterium]|nr:hypothetical protein [Planctomycetota bacterium]